MAKYGLFKRKSPHKRIIPEEDMDLILQQLEDGLSYQEIAAMYSCTAQCVKDSIKRYLNCLGSEN